MSLVLKSNKPFTGDMVDLYKSRVLADGGQIMNESAARDAFAFFNSNNLNGAKILSATAGEWGVKLVDGRLQKLYSLFGERGDVEITEGSLDYYFSFTNGKYSFASTGSKTTHNTSKGEYAVSNIAMFASVNRTANNPSPLFTPVLHFQNVGGGNDGAGVYFSHTEDAYLIKTLDDAYKVEDIPFKNNIGMKLSDNLVAYQDGIEVVNVPAKKLTGSAYKFSLAATVDNSQGGSKTPFYAGIIATNLEDSEARVLSGYVADYLAV